MRYVVAALVAAFVLLAGIELAGAGHGWVSGGFGCFALAPISGFAWVNVLRNKPSLPGAVATLAVGLVVCLVVGIATTSEGSQYFSGYWRASGAGGILVGSFAYLNWVLVSVWAVFRAQRALRPGT
jgi:hypothetical protein